MNVLSPSEQMARHQLAHDLQSPIRAITIYAELMERTMLERRDIPTEFEAYCSGIVAAAGELGELVDGFAEGRT